MHVDQSYPGIKPQREKKIKCILLVIRVKTRITQSFEKYVFHPESLKMFGSLSKETKEMNSKANL